MNMEFETTFVHSRTGSGTTTSCMVQVNEAEVWVAWSDGKITKHNVLGYDGALRQQYYFDNQTVAQEATIAVVPGGTVTIFSMSKLGDMVYALYLSGSTFGIAGVNIHSRAVVSNYIVPFSSTLLGSNVLAINGNLVVASNDVDSSDNNLLHVCNIATGVWNTISITGKKQIDIRHMIDGLDGRIYITAKNEHGIVELNTTTGVQQIHRINRHTYRLGVNQNKDLWVISDLNNGNNLLTLYNQSSNTGVPFCSFDGNSTVLDDLRTQRLWGVGATTTRVDKTSLDGVTAGVAGREACLTNQFTYDKYDPSTDTVTSTTIRPYLVIRTDNQVYLYRATALKAVNSSEVLVTAMLATGAQGYYGG